LGGVAKEDAKEHREKTHNSTTRSPDTTEVTANLSPLRKLGQEKTWANSTAPEVTQGTWPQR